MPESTPVRRRYQWLEPALAPDGAIILTASRRLARELRDAYNRQQVDAGRTAWPTPPISFARDWVRRQFDHHESAGNRQVLQGSAAALIWERCVGRHAGETVLGVTALARLAASTWRIVNDWRIPIESIVRSARTQDERLFAAAADDFRRNVQQGDWSDDGGATDTVIELLGSGAIKLSGPVTLVGFDRLPPAFEALIDALRSQGTEVSVRGPAQHSKTRVSSSFVDDAAELRAAGAWAFAGDCTRRTVDTPSRAAAELATAAPSSANTATSIAAASSAAAQATHFPTLGLSSAPSCSAIIRIRFVSAITAAPGRSTQRSDQKRLPP